MRLRCDLKYFQQKASKLRVWSAVRDLIIKDLLWKTSESNNDLK